jgi:hypothetical protein
MLSPPFAILRNRSVASASTSRALGHAAYQKFDSRVTDAALLVVVSAGVFRFQDALGTWWTDETLYESFQYTKMTARGRTLVRKIHAETSSRPR